MMICMVARVTARNTQDRTVEQMWNSSVPHFPDFKILSIDSHRSQMSHHRHELALQATSYGCDQHVVRYEGSKLERVL